MAISWQATLLSMIGGALIIWASHFLVRMARKAGRKQTQLMVSLMSHLTDMLQSVKPLKAMGREDLVDDLLNNETNRLNKTMRRQVLAGAALTSGQDLMFIVLDRLRRLSSAWRALDRFRDSSYPRAHAGAYL